jgi:hypothetical protein
LLATTTTTTSIPTSSDHDGSNHAPGKPPATTGSHHQIVLIEHCFARAKSVSASRPTMDGRGGVVVGIIVFGGLLGNFLCPDSCYFLSMIPASSSSSIGVIIIIFFR